MPHVDTALLPERYRSKMINGIGTTFQGMVIMAAPPTSFAMPGVPASTGASSFELSPPRVSFLSTSANAAIGPSWGVGTINRSPEDIANAGEVACALTLKLMGTSTAPHTASAFAAFFTPVELKTLASVSRLPNTLEEKFRQITNAPSGQILRETIKRVDRVGDFLIQLAKVSTGHLSTIADKQWQTLTRAMLLLDLTELTGVLIKAGNTKNDAAFANAVEELATKNVSFYNAMKLTDFDKLMLKSLLLEVMEVGGYGVPSDEVVKRIFPLIPSYFGVAEAMKLKGLPEGTRAMKLSAMIKLPLLAKKAVPANTADGIIAEMEKVAKAVAAVRNILSTEQDVHKLPSNMASQFRETLQHSAPASWIETIERLENRDQIELYMYAATRQVFSEESRRAAAASDILKKIGSFGHTINTSAYEQLINLPIALLENLNASIADSESGRRTYKLLTYLNILLLPYLERTNLDAITAMTEQATAYIGEMPEMMQAALRVTLKKPEVL